jgi:hypothetical protein
MQCNNQQTTEQGSAKVARGMQATAKLNAIFATAALPLLIVVSSTAALNPLLPLIDVLSTYASLGPPPLSSL